MRHLVRSIVSNYLALGVQAASVVVLAPLFIHHQGVASFGRWSVIGAIIGYLQLSDLGVSLSIARSVATSRSTERLGAALNASIGLLIAVSSVLLLAAGAVALTAPESATPHSFHVALACAVAIFAIRLPLTAADQVLYGLGRMVERNVFLAASALAALIANATVLLLGGGLVEVVLCGALAQLAVSVTLAAYVLVRIEGVRFSPRLIDRAQLRSMATVTTGILGLNVAAQIIVYSDTLVVGALYGAVSTGVYAVAMRAVQGATLLLNQISDAFFPGFAHAHARDDQQVAQRVSLATSLAVCMAMALVGMLVVFGDRLIHLWVGSGFGRAWIPMLLLSTSLVLNGPLRYAVLWSIAGNLHGQLARIALIEAAINLVLAVGLGIAFGLIGVASASCATFIASNGIVMPRLLFPMLGLDWRACFGRPIVVSSIAVLPASALLHWLLASHHIATGVVVAASLGWLVFTVVVLTPIVVGRRELRGLRSALIAARAA
jgi:O-antigen/teichoic acid export membrane protein